jgi:hypothetical protein
MEQTGQVIRRSFDGESENPTPTFSAFMSGSSSNADHTTLLQRPASSVG